MLDFNILIQRSLYRHVMNNEKIKNKVFGFLWRQMLIGLAISFSVLAVFAFMNLLIPNALPWSTLLVVAVIMLVACIVAPILQYKFLCRVAESANREIEKLRK